MSKNIPALTRSQYRDSAETPHRRGTAFAYLVALSAVFSAHSVGCSNPVDTSKNNLIGGDVGVAAGDSVDVAAGDSVDAADVNTIACGCLVPGMAWRFDKLALDSIDGGQHPVQGTLNTLWKKDILAHELNFYVSVLAVSATEVTLNVVNGARNVGTVDDVCLLPYTNVKIVHPRDGCALQASAPTGMNVYAGTPANPKNCAPTLPVKHAIPVRGAVLQSLVTADCSRLDAGQVSAGHLPSTALGKTCTCVTTGKQGAEDCGEPDASFTSDTNCDGCNGKFQNLKTLLQAFGELSYKCKEGDDPAACLTASFTGARIDALPPVCAGF